VRTAPPLCVRHTALPDHGIVQAQAAGAPAQMHHTQLQPVAHMMGHQASPAYPYGDAWQGQAPAHPVGTEAKPPHSSADFEVPMYTAHVVSNVPPRQGVEGPSRTS
jgi:hypothetical protein